MKLVDNNIGAESSIPPSPTFDSSPHHGVHHHGPQIQRSENQMQPQPMHSEMQTSSSRLEPPRRIYSRFTRMETLPCKETEPNFDPRNWVHSWKQLTREID